MDRDHPAAGTGGTSQAPATIYDQSPWGPATVYEDETTAATTDPAVADGHTSTTPVFTPLAPGAAGGGPVTGNPLGATAPKPAKQPVQTTGMGGRPAGGMSFSPGIAQPETRGTGTTPGTPPAPGSRSRSRPPADPVDDRDLVNDYKAGNDTAFDAIVARHRSKLRWVARRYARTEADAEDILQEALLAASQGLGKFRGDAKLSTWLHRIVANTGYDHINRASMVEQTVLDDNGFGLSLLETTGVDDPHLNLEWTLTLRDLLDQLPQVQRDALVLIDVAGHTVRQVAHMQGVPSGTVKSRRSRAKKFLRRHIENTVVAAETTAQQDT